MEKLLKKWIRKLHRWLVIPFTLILLTAMIGRGSAIGNAAQRIQVIFMIILAVTGIYLYLLPYWSKWKREKSKELK
jgi:hypothetical protein